MNWLFDKMRFGRRECRPALRRPESPRPGISGGRVTAQSPSTLQPEAQPH